MKKSELKKAINSYLLDTGNYYSMQNLYIEIYKLDPSKFLNFIFNLRNQLEEYEMQYWYEERMKKQKSIINYIIK